MYEVNGTYGMSKTPCVVFVYENRNGSKWYCVEGSCNINKTWEDISDGVDVETISDFDTMTRSSAIESLTELEQAIEA